MPSVFDIRAALVKAGVALDKPADIWRHIIATKHWTSFATLTFKTEPHPEAADKLWQIAIAVGGWRTSDWIRVSELQERGVIHFHALLGASRYKGSEELMALWWKNNVAPMCVVEEINDNALVQTYVTKYCAKDKVFDLDRFAWSPSFRPVSNLIGRGGDLRGNKGLEYQVRG